MAHKFFNFDSEENDEENEETEYSDKIHISSSKARDEYIDRNNVIARIFLIALGVFCILGITYYIVAWLSTK